MTEFDEKLFKLFQKLDQDLQYPGDAAKVAIEFLDREGQPLSEDQKTAVIFLVEAAYRNRSDTWDHEIRGVGRVTTLLKKVIE